MSSSADFALSLPALPSAKKWGLVLGGAVAASYAVERFALHRATSLVTVVLTAVITLVAFQVISAVPGVGGLHVPHGHGPQELEGAIVAHAYEQVGPPPSPPADSEERVAAFVNHM